MNTTDPKNQLIEAVLFENEFCKFPRKFEGALSDLIGFTHVIRPTKKGSPAFSCTIYRDGLSRSKDSILSLTALVLDLDGVTLSDLRVISARISRFAYVAYSTASHDPLNDHHRLRLIILLDRYITPSEFEVIFEVVQLLCESKLDKSGRDISHIFYLPTATETNKKHAWINYHTGMLLPVAEVLACPKSFLKKHSIGHRIEFRRSQNYGHSNGSFRPVQKSGVANDVRTVCRHCLTYLRLLEKADNGLHLSHAERFAIAQLSISLGLPNSEIIPFFSKLDNFDPKKTIYQIESIRRKAKYPSCKTLSTNFQVCNGTCEASRKANAKSPIKIIAWNIKE